MWLRPSGGPVRVEHPVVGAVLLGDAADGYDYGESHTVVPGDYKLIGYGAVPVTIEGREGESISAGSQVYVIEVDGDHLIVQSSAGDPVERESAP